MTIAVSVIVPTCNRPDLLERCLAALVEQDMDPRAYDIVVADDAASVETQRQVEEWRERCAGTGPAIQYVPVRNTQGPAAARNAGWRGARGAVIAFTDDDCIPQPGWLAAGVRAIAQRIRAPGNPNMSRSAGFAFASPGGPWTSSPKPSR